MIRRHASARCSAVESTSPATAGHGLIALRRFAHPMFPWCFRDGGDCPAARRGCAHRAEYLTATERASGYDYPDLARERCATRT